MEVPENVVASIKPNIAEASLGRDGAEVDLRMDDYCELVFDTDFDTARRIVEDCEHVRVLVVMDDEGAE